MSSRALTAPPQPEESAYSRPDRAVRLTGRRAEIRRRWQPLLAVSPVLLFLLAILTVPLVITFVASLRPSIVLDLPRDRYGLWNYTYLLGTPAYQQVIWRTLRVAGLTVLLSLLAGYPTAYYLQKYAERLGSTAILALCLPILTGPLVIVLGWMIVMANGGPLNRWLQALHLVDGPLNLLGTETAVVIGLVHYTLPFVVLNIFNALLQIDPYLLEAAVSLGATPWRTFWHVTFPLSLPGLVSASIISFSLAVSAFIAPAYLGAGRKVLVTNLISQLILGTYNQELAATAATILLVMSLAIVMVYNRTFTRLVK